MDSNQEKALLQRAIQGDFEAFEALVDAYQDRLFHLARRIVANNQDAEDVVQQTFLTLVESLRGFRGESTLWTWLVKVATNHALKVLRKKRGLPVAAPLGDPEEPGEGSQFPHPEFIAEWRKGPEQLAQLGETQAAIDQAVAQLEEKYRVVFLLRDGEGFSVKETAGFLEISETLVKVRLLRARLKLREILTRRFGDESKRLIPDHRHG